MLWLFLIPSLIWGSTWYVITLQFGSVPPEISVFYRFTLSAALALLYCRLRGLQLKYSRADHAWFLLHGACNFCMNYVLTYYAETLISSGLVAVTFTVLPYFNALGARFIYKQQIAKKTILAMCLGGVGIFLLFQREILAANSSDSTVQGLVVGVVATLFASFGNLTSLQYKKRNIHTLSGTSWAMFYGALSVLIVCVLRGHDLLWKLSGQYVAALLYLAVFGTVVAFLTYFTLIARIGATRAAYTSILIPVIALAVSTIYEKFSWTISTWIGIGLILSGNFLILDRQKTK